MKIYFIGQKGIPAVSGGIERHVEEVATRLAQKGHQVFVYTRPYYTPAKRKTYKKVNLISLPTVKSKYLDAIAHTCLATLDVLKRDADIIHYHGIGPASLLWIPRLLKRKSRVIFTYHCQDYFHQKWGPAARIYLRLGEFVGTMFAHQVVAVSRTLKKYLKSKYHRLVIYLPNGAPTVSKARTVGALNKFELKKGQYVLTVGRLIRHKGVHTLIEAYQKLLTDKKLVIVGDGFYTDSYVDELKRLAALNPKIIFTGAQTGRPLAELFSHAYAFVQPSEAEGLSVALLEALAYGKAVLVSNIEENMEVIGGKMLAFRSGQVRDLQSKLKFLLDHPELIDQLSGIGKTIAKDYHWPSIAEGLEALYRVSLLNGEIESKSFLGSEILRQKESS